MGRNQPHTVLVKGCLSLLALYKIPSWSQNTGAGQMKSGRFVRFGFPGIADILGILPGAGTFFSVECKVGKDKQSAAQLDFESMVRRAGGVYIEVRDIEKFEKLLKIWRRNGEIGEGEA